MYEGALLDLVVDRLQKEAKVAEEYWKSQYSASPHKTQQTQELKAQELKAQEQKQRSTIEKPSAPYPSVLFGKIDEPKTFEAHIQDLLGKAYASREILSRETDKAEIKHTEEEKGLKKYIPKEFEITRTLLGVGEEAGKRIESVLPPGLKNITSESVRKELELGGRIVEKEGKEMISALGEKIESFYKTLTNPLTPFAITKTVVEKYIELERTLHQKTIEAGKIAQEVGRPQISDIERVPASTMPINTKKDFSEEIKKEEMLRLIGVRSTMPVYTEEDFSRLIEAEKMSKTIGEFIPTSQERKLTESQEKLLKENPIHSLGLGLFGETYEVMLGRKSWEDLSRKETVEKAYEIEIPQDVYSKFFEGGKLRPDVQRIAEGDKTTLMIKEEGASHQITIPTNIVSKFFEGDKLRQDVKISEKEGGVILTAVEAEEKKVETPFWEKFAIGGGFLGGVTSVVIGVPLLAKKAVTEGVAEAGKEAVVGSAMIIGAIPSKITSRNPVLIGEALADISVFDVAGRVGSKITKTPGKISETIEFIGKERVPIEKLTQPEILKGEAKFPYTREIEGMKYGERAPAEKAVEMNIEMFYKDPAALATKLGREAREEGKAYGFHATPEKFGKEITPRDAPARRWDVGGMYIAPDVSIRFLRIIQERGSLGFSFEELIKNPIPTSKEMLKRTFGFDRPMIAGFKLEGVERVPPEYRTSLEKMKEFFSTGMEKGVAKPGYAYVEPKVEIGHVTGESQAVLPPKGVWREAESSQYTKLHGKKILIKEYAPKLEEGKLKAEIEPKSKLEDTKIVEKSKKELFTEKEISSLISERYQTYLYRDVSYDFSRLLAGSKELIKSEGKYSEYSERLSVQPSYVGERSSPTSPIKSEMKASSKISEIESSSKDSLITSPIKSEMKSEIESSSKKESSKKEDTQYTQTYYSEASKILRNVDKKIGGVAIAELSPEKRESEKLRPKIEKRLFKQELPATAEWFWAMKHEALTKQPAKVVIEVGSKKMKEVSKGRLKFGLATSIKGYEGR